jgi:hypothetical protein
MDMEATRGELEKSIAQARSLSEEWLATAARLEEQLAALPAEPVRLLAFMAGDVAYIKAEREPSESYVACVLMNICNKYGIDPAALSTHICRFGQPDPRDAQLAAMQVERDNWIETARGYANSVEYYQGIIDQILEPFGIAARTSDDGSVQDHPLRAKAVELVTAQFAAADALAEAVRVYATKNTWHKSIASITPGARDIFNAPTAYRTACGVVR